MKGAVMSRTLFEKIAAEGEELRRELREMSSKPCTMAWRYYFLASAVCFAGGLLVGYVNWVVEPSRQKPGEVISPIKDADVPPGPPVREPARLKPLWPSTPGSQPRLAPPPVFVPA